MLKGFILALIIATATCLAQNNHSIASREPIAPLPDYSPNDADQKKIELGKILFNDRKLSKNGTVSCASCHNLNRGGVDGQQFSTGINGARGDINAPTVFNSGFNFRQFWNGRSATLEEQIDGPIQHPKEMGNTWDAIVKSLKEDPQYQQLFRDAYKSEINKQTIKDAIAAFERALVTPNSKFDRYLKGDETVLSLNEKLGFQKFKSYGCIACHQGMNVGGNMFQTMGVMGNYFKDRGTPISDTDLGRFQVTKMEADKHVFRVPSLRNVALTAPYFHDGSAQTLEQAVNVMAKYQLGRKLSTEDIDLIVSFLKTLTGDTPLVLKGGVQTAGSDH